jgi:predicted DsbA family dithiol-disulfide isomerase
VHFPLHPETPAEGRSLADLFGGRDLGPIHARLERLLDAEGLPHVPRTHTYNSRLAQELGKWADTRPGFETIHDAIYRAYFAQSRNIGDLGVLVDIAQSVGLSPAAARDVLEERRFKDAVDSDWAKSRREGVTGVPTFAMGHARVVGAQPYEVLEQLAKHAGARVTHPTGEEM